MSVTQYIGARYVPLFAEPIEWDNARAYEPLTIVVHQGNSYTSRQSVPIGIDILNEQYWALTGNYNAQVEAYRREVAAYDERISDNTEAIANAETAIADAQAAIGTETEARESADSTLQEAISAETEARESADTTLQESVSGIEAMFPVNTPDIANAAVTVDKLAQDVKQMNSARDMLLDVDTYIDYLDGDDETGEVGNAEKPFKTLDAAFSAADQIGNNFRFYFLRSGEYTLTARVIVGSVIHFFTELASGEVVVNIDTGVEQGGLFIYDTHLACYGTAEARLTINTTARYIEIEGGTLWSRSTNFKFYGDREGYLYLLDGSSHFDNTDVYGAISSVWGSIRIQNTRIHNLGDRPAFQMACGILRTQGTSFQVDSNPNATTKTAIALFSCQANFDGDTLWSRNTNALGYKNFCQSSSSLLMITEALRNTWNSYTKEPISLNAITPGTGSNIAV